MDQVTSGRQRKSARGAKKRSTKPRASSKTKTKEITIPKPKCRILIVDDYEDTAEVLGLLLSDWDYEIQRAGTVKEAMDLAKSQEFDLYVLDKQLPDGSGLDLCQQLNIMTPGVPCIFYSGDAYEVHRQEAIQAGADSYIIKPDIEGLIDTVQRFLADRECAAT